MTFSQTLNNIEQHIQVPSISNILLPSLLFLIISMFTQLAPFTAWWRCETIMKALKDNIQCYQETWRHTDTDTSSSELSKSSAKAALHKNLSLNSYLPCTHCSWNEKIIKTELHNITTKDPFMTGSVGMQEPRMNTYMVHTTCRNRKR